MLRPAITTVSLLLWATGCPSSIDASHREPVKQVPVVDERDPRVSRDGDDLYPKKVLDRANLARGEPSVPADNSPGTGTPDESNGTCRLYAPKLRNPQCCVGEFGLDVDVIAKACELPTYLGESFQHSCGYYFFREGKREAWFRMSTVPGGTVAEAAKSHDRRMKHLLKDNTFSSKPIPGVPDALWSTTEGLAWAFLPGWKNVRQLAWRTEFCVDETMFGVIKQITEAGEPEPGGRRLGMTPKARPGS